MGWVSVKLRLGSVALFWVLPMHRDHLTWDWDKQYLLDFLHVFLGVLKLGVPHCCEWTVSACPWAVGDPTWEAQWCSCYDLMTELTLSAIMSYQYRPHTWAVLARNVSIFFFSSFFSSYILLPSTDTILYSQAFLSFRTVQSPLF